MLLLRGPQPAVLMDAGRRTRRKQLQLLQNYFGCVATGAKLWQELTWGPQWTPHRRLWRTWPANICRQGPDTFKPVLLRGCWTRPAFDSVFLMLSARFIVEGPVTQRPWCQPRSMSVRDLVPAPKFCYRWTKQSLFVSSWPMLLWLLWNPYSWKQFFHWLHGLLLCFSLPGMLKHFYFFFNKIENSQAWAGGREKNLV